MMNKTATLRKAWTALGVLTALILGGCADGNTGAAPDATDTDNAAEQTDDPSANDEESTGGPVDYPHDELTFIVGSGPGSGMDGIARVLAGYLEPILETQIVIENIAGAGATLALADLYTRPNDGSVVALGGSNALTVYPQANPDLPYDGWDDFTVLGEIAVNPMVVVTGANSGLSGLEDVVTDAEARPGELTVSQPGNLSAPGLGAELLAMTAGVEFNSVAISGGGAEARTEVIAGRAEIGVGGATLYQGQVEAGELVPVAALWDERLSAYPDTPTAQEQGYDVVYAAYHFFVAPGGLDPALQQTLHEALLTASADPEYQQRADELGAVLRSLSIAETEDELSRLTEAGKPLLERVQARNGG